MTGRGVGALHENGAMGRSLAGGIAVALALAGCGGEASSGPEPDRPADARPRLPRAALCAHLRTRVVGRVTAEAATELSGLVVSRSQDGVLWTHNDSGDSARLFAVAPDGRLLAEVAVTGAEAVDWEDIAIGPGDMLYVGDIGDNDAARSDIVVYRVTEPRLTGGTATRTAPAQRLTLRYPDGAHDAEALLVEPSSGAIVIVTKTYGGTAGVYVADHPSPHGTTALRRAGSASLGIGRAVTAGDVSANGRTIALRTYDRVFVWSRRRGESLASVLRRGPCTAGARLLGEGQGEALALTRAGRAFYTVTEGSRPALRRYAPALATSATG
jgi:hypothetical protein